ncbi:MAG: RNA-guided endonuclease IscB [Acidimicrobiales bacterium]
MSTLHVSEKTNQGMLPQSPALESTSADKPGVGTKRGVETRSQDRVAGVQLGRGEIPAGLTTNRQERHPSSSEQSGGEGDRGFTAPPSISASRVFVLDMHGHPLMPCRPARARKLLSSGRARVHRLAPFVIRLVDRTAANSVIPGVEVAIDPGSKATGISVFQTTTSGRVGLVGVEVQHRGQLIHKKMDQRSNYRRGRRSRNLRHRAPRFDNRTRPKGWLAPSLRHRVDTTMSMVSRLRRWSPVTAIHQELVHFDMQKMENPEITGTEYQQGTLAGYEAREYLLAKFNRTCAYCGATDVPLNIDHIYPRSKGGTDRVSNLVLACIDCNQSKGNLNLNEWLISRFGPSEAVTISKRMLSRAKAPLKDAAAVNSTRWALYQALQAIGLPVSTGTGGQTKWNRSRFGVPKTHTLDAICVGEVDGVVSYPTQVIVAKATGRGTYQRAQPDAYGFTAGHYLKPGEPVNPSKGHKPRRKSNFGFRTGDLVRAVVPKGKYVGVHVGRVAVRASGRFMIATRAGRAETSHKNCRLAQLGDGWLWSVQPEGVSHAA